MITVILIILAFLVMCLPELSFKYQYMNIRDAVEEAEEKFYEQTNQERKK